MKGATEMPRGEPVARELIRISAPVAAELRAEQSRLTKELGRTVDMPEMVERAWSVYKQAVAEHSQDVP
jgi:hypothetical protein